MKHLRWFNENNLSEINEDNIRDSFAHTFDILESDGYEINEAYFDVSSKIKRNWANNDFSNDVTMCQRGFDISIYHKFYDKTDIADFEKFVEIVNQLSEDINRFKELYSTVRITKHLKIYFLKMVVMQKYIY